jgi:hypothetical protein
MNKIKKKGKNATKINLEIMYQHCIYLSAIFLSLIVLHFDLYGGRRV